MSKDLGAILSSKKHASDAETSHFFAITAAIQRLRFVPRTSVTAGPVCRGPGERAAGALAACPRRPRWIAACNAPSAGVGSACGRTSVVLSPLSVVRCLLVACPLVLYAARPADPLARRIQLFRIAGWGVKRTIRFKLECCVESRIYADAFKEAQNSPFGGQK
jgi:hypothetical protein